MTSAARTRTAAVSVALAAQAAVSALQQGLPSLSLPLREDLGLSLTGLGVLLGASNTATAATVLAWGAWSDRVGDRRVLLLGLPLSAAALAAAACAAAARSAPGTASALVLAGGGAAAGSAALARALADRVPPSRLGVALGLRQAAVPAGGLLAAAALPAAAAAGGPAAALGGLAMLLTAACVGVARGLPDHDRPPAGGPGPVGWRHAGRVAVPGLGRLLGANACYCVAQTGAVALSVTAWRDATGQSTAVAALLFGSTQVASAAARIASGRLADAHVAREGALLAGLGAATASLLGALAVAHAAGAPGAAQAALLLVACLPAASWNGLAFSASTRLATASSARHRLGRVHGLQNTVLFSAAGLTPPVMAALVTATGWSVAWALLAAAAALGAVVQTLPPRQRPPTPLSEPSTTRDRRQQCASSRPTISS